MKQEMLTSLRKVVSNSFKKKTREKRLLTMIGKPKPLVLQKAEEIQSKLSQNHPSFIKRLVPSHVSGSFWMKLPSAFCNPNLPKKSIDLTLLDHNENEYAVKCLDFSLSGGWRGFAMTHKLVEGDALVFELIEAYKFKVHIVRARDLAHADLARSLPNIDISAQGSVPGAKKGQIIKKCTGKYLNSHSASPIPGEDQHTLLPSAGGEDTNATNGSPAENRTEFHPSVPFPGGVDQNTNLEQAEHRSSAEGMDTEGLEDVRLPVPAAGVQDLASLDSFAIIVNGISIDPEISEDVRTKYYALCRSQKSYLHKNLMEGLNCKIVAEVISDLVNVADAIRASKLSTPKEKFEAWGKSLLAFKHLGMNVEFLLARVDIHLQQASAFDYNSAVMEEDRLKKEITACEAKLFELRNDSIRMQRELTTLQGNREKHESAFRSTINSPW